jgi:hypothetical protein
MMKTISEVRREDIEALSKALGPVDMARFISSYDTGAGDYTRDRLQWLPIDHDEIVANLLERQKDRDKDSSSSQSLQ